MCSLQGGFLFFMPNNKAILFPTFGSSLRESPKVEPVFWQFSSLLQFPEADF
jgi:hypothetical protein